MIPTIPKTDVDKDLVKLPDINKTSKQIQNERRLQKQKLINEQMKARQDAKNLKIAKADEEARKSIANTPDAIQEQKDKIYSDSAIDTQVLKDQKIAEGTIVKGKNIAEIQREEQLARNAKAKTMADNLANRKNNAVVKPEPDQPDVSPTNQAPPDAKPLSFKEQLQQKQKEIGQKGEEELGTTEPAVKAGSEQESQGATKGSYKEGSRPEIKTDVADDIPVDNDEARDAVNEKIGNLSDDDYNSYKSLVEKNKITGFDYGKKNRLVNKIENKSLEKRYNALPTDGAREDFEKGLAKENTEGIEPKKNLMKRVEDYHNNPDNFEEEEEDTPTLPDTADEPEEDQYEGFGETEDDEDEKEDEPEEEYEGFGTEDEDEDEDEDDDKDDDKDDEDEDPDPDKDEFGEEDDIFGSSTDKTQVDSSPIVDTPKPTITDTDALADNLKKDTLDSTIDDDNPIGDFVTLGLGLASVIAPLFSHTAKESPQNPMNQSSQFGET